MSFLAQVLERLLRLRVAGVGRLLIPLAGFVPIVGNAFAKRVPHAQVVHRSKRGLVKSQVLPTRVRPHPPADWLGGAERGVLLSAHEHALRNRSRRGQTAPSGTEGPARTPRPESRCAPTDNGGIAGATRTLAPKARPAAEPRVYRQDGGQEILDDIRAERC
jgi:hypothetical protein